jgi:hypothetical protein
VVGEWAVPRGGRMGCAPWWANGLCPVVGEWAVPRGGRNVAQARFLASQIHR